MLFNEYAVKISNYFSDLKLDLKRARIKSSVEEYLSKAILTAFIVFLFELPLFSFIYGLVFKNFLFSFITAFTTSVFLAVIFFYLYINYPKTIIRQKSKEIDDVLPFVSLYLSTLAGSKLPLDKIFKVFTKFSGYGTVGEEFKKINNDIDMFGIDVNTALERAVERSPSKKFRELLWGILSTTKSGGDLAIYLKEKANTLMADYRRRLSSFAHSLTVYIEVYLTGVILGAVFFTILTAIMSGIGGGYGNILALQFLLIFIFIPMISIAFIFMIKAATPGGE